MRAPERLTPKDAEKVLSKLIDDKKKIKRWRKHHDREARDARVAGIFLLLFLILTVSIYAIVKPMWPGFSEEILRPAIFAVMGIFVVAWIVRYGRIKL